MTIKIKKKRTINLSSLTNRAILRNQPAQQAEKTEPDCKYGYTYKFDRYLSDEHQSVLNKALNQDSDNLLIVAPTGAGKSTAIINYGKANVDKKIAFLMPTRALVDNLKLDNIDIPCGYGSDFIMCNKFKNFIISTYDSIRYLKDSDMVVMDEAHNLAAQSGFRDVLPSILDVKTKLVLLSGTPEIIDNLGFNTLKFQFKYSLRKEVKVLSTNYNAKTLAFNIINNFKSDNTKLLWIRINDKNIIDQLFDFFKNTRNIAKYYSDNNEVISCEQSSKTVDNLSKGIIDKDINILLTTSIYDAGLSLKVGKDVEGYSINNYNSAMPNPIDMMQLNARVRENSGFKLDLTIVGKFGDYTIEDNPLPYGRINTKQLCSRMNNIYKEYSLLDLHSYVGILEYYNIMVTEISDKEYDNYVDIDYISIIRPIQIIRNLHNFSDYSMLVDKAKETNNSEQLKYVSGKRVFKDCKMTSEVKRMFHNVYDAFEYGIPLNEFIDNAYREKRINNLLYVCKNYNHVRADLFSRAVDEILTPAIENVDNTKISLNRFNDLLESQQSAIKAIVTLFYKKVRYDRGSIVLKLKPIDKKLSRFIGNFDNRYLDDVV